MKQYYNRILAVLLTALLCVSLLCVGAPPVAAAEGTCGEDLTWVLADGRLTISGSGPMTDYTEYNMPPWLEHLDLIQRVVIEKGVTSVGDLAFYHCTALTTVSLPDTVLTLGELAFAGCTALYTVPLPAVQEIGWGGFYGCAALTNVVLPDTLRVIGDQAFYMCESLAGIVIPTGVESLGSSVFTYCDSLVYVRVEAPLETLPYWSFYGCENLDSLYLPDTVKTVEEGAVSECDSLYYVDGGTPEAKKEIEKQLSQPNTRPNDPTTEKDVTYTQTDGAIITTTDNTLVGVPNGVEDPPSGTHIQATVTDPSGWSDVTGAIAGAVDAGKTPTVNVQLQGDTILPEGALGDLADKEVTVTIQTPGDVSWQVVLGDQTDGTHKGDQDLGITIEENTKNRYKNTIGDVPRYILTMGNSDLNATVSIPLGKGTARQTATLYRVKGGSLEKLTSVLVDNDGKASFRLGSIDKGKYLLALNVADIDPQEVLIPEKLAPEYDITYGSTLTDSQGNQYVLVGRVNMLGISLGTLTWIVVGILVGSGLLVGGIMLMWNKQRNRKYQPEHKT